MKLEDAVAVVTGASRGIGKATAIALAKRGARVVCMARSSDASPSKLPGTIDDTVRSIESLGGRAMAVPCDVSQEDQVEALARETLAEFGRIDILVNNAGQAFYIEPFLETPLRHWNRVLGVNLIGAILCIRAFLPRMIKQGIGSIVNISSAIVTNPAQAAMLQHPPYFVSKMALEGLTQVLAVEMEPHKIPVNCLRIDLVVLSEGWQPDPKLDLSHAERPEVAAESIIWLATRDPSYTGHILSLTDARALSRSGQGRA
jgi:NAD(P)-dependent dehydrogenase (short-subunit alcohol dehydrogenase family)